MLADSKALDDRRAALEQQEKDSAVGKKTFGDRNAAFMQKETDFSTNKKALDDREAALANREKDSTAERNKKTEELKGLWQKKLGAGGLRSRYKHYKPPRKLEKNVIRPVYKK